MEKLIVFILIFYNFNLISDGKKVESLASDDEGRLKDYLFKFKGYNHLIRPVVNLTDVINVKFDLALIQLINVEEKKQILKSNVWIRMNWVDYQLVWEPADFGGIKVTRVSPKIVWKPDIVLFNNADGNYEVLWQPNILIQYDGVILWIPPAIYESSCRILVEYFPFDEQVCDMRFGSWTFNSRQVTLSWLNDPKIDLSTYWLSGTWDIISCPGRITNGSVDSSGIDTQEIVYQITIRRKTLFYTVILILPCLLISMLTVCVFYLPVDDHHKMTLTISILLALIVFFLLISKLLPPTSTSIPLISKYLLFTFIVNIIVIVITVIIINFNYRTPRTHCMPSWVRKVFIEFFPTVLGMSRPKHIELELLDKKRIGAISPCIIKQQKRISNMNEPVSSAFHKLKPNSKRLIKMVDCQISMALMNEKSKQYSDNTDKDIWKSQNSRLIQTTSYNKIISNSFTFPRNWEDIEQIPRRSFTDSTSSKSDSSTRLTDEMTNNWLFRGYEINHEMRQAILSINFISSHTESQGEFLMGKQDWQFVASVIDRLMLLIFSTVTIIGTAALFFRAPYFFTLMDATTNINKC